MSTADPRYVTMLIEGERLQVQVREDGTVVERRLTEQEITLLVLHRREAWRKLIAEMDTSGRIEPAVRQVAMELDTL